MRIWSLSDLHLSLGTDKPMDIFGDHWAEHHQQMAEAWDDLVDQDDIMLTPGDFSWATKPDQVAPDFIWLGKRPGYKILVKGNHDYWWPKTRNKMAALLPEKTYALKKKGCMIDSVAFFGVRGGDFAPLTRYGDTRSQEQVDAELDREERELRASLADMEAQIAASETPISRRICLFHYPPIPPGRRHSRFSSIIEASGASHCIYGHLHGSESQSARIEGNINGVEYHCASCDLQQFRPHLVVEETGAASSGR